MTITVRTSVLGLRSLTVALTLSVAILLAVGSVNAHAAVTLDSFTVNATTHAVAAHPEVTLDVATTSTGSDRLDSVQFTLPAGMSFNPAAAASKCSSFALALDSCPAASTIGSVEAGVGVGLAGLPLGSVNAGGSIHALNDGIGVVLRSSGYSPVIFRQRLGTSAGSTTLTSSTLPRWILRYGLVPLELRFRWIVFRYGTSNAGSPPGPPWFLTNPGDCAPNETQARISAASGASASATQPYTVTGCDTTPPQIDITSPADGSSTASDSVTFSYTATDNSGAEPTCDRPSDETVALTPGTNEISVICWDDAGNTASATTSVTYVPPQASTTVTDDVIVFADESPDPAPVDNDLTVTLESGFVVFTDDASPIEPAAGCAALSENSIACPANARTEIVVHGGPGDDNLTVNAPIDAVLEGNDGNDTLVADFYDHLYGGPGNDTLYGGPGTDHLSGGPGNDDLHGEDGEDTLIGDAGSDTLTGDASSDRFFADDGEQDTVNCDTGDSSAQLDAQDIAVNCASVPAPTQPVTLFTSGPATGETITTSELTFSFETIPATPGVGVCIPDPLATAPSEWIVISPCTSPQSITFADGHHSLGVAITADGNYTGLGSLISDYDLVEFDVDTSGPQTTIDGAPADPTNTATLTWSFSSEPGATFECSVVPSTGPGAQAPVWGACSGAGSHETTVAGDGEYDFAVRATDVIDQIGETAVDTDVTVDTSKPETFVTPVADPGNVTLPTWSYSSDDLTATFRCSLVPANSAPSFATCPGTGSGSYTPVAALGDGEYDFAVQAVDPATNEDDSPASQDDFTVDLTGAVATITDEPTDPDNETTLTWDFSSELGATFECSFAPAGGPDAFGPCSGSGTHTVTGVAEGEYDFKVKATDSVGNAGSPAEDLDVTVDLNGPVATITDEPTDPDNETTLTWVFSSEPGATFECSFVPAGGPDAFGPCSGSGTHTENGVTDGDWDFAVRATDSANNTGTPDEDNDVTVDTAEPTASITAPSGLTGDNMPSIAFTTSDATPSSGISLTHCSVDDGAYFSCASGDPITVLTNGPHTLAVRVTDAAGNVDSSPPEISFRVDARPFDVAVTATRDTAKATLHPDLQVSLSFEGAVDTAGANVTLPKGMHLAPAAVAAADRCQAANAAAGTCGAASQIGTVSATAITPAFGEQSLSGSIHVTDAPDAGATAGVVLQLSSANVTSVVAGRVDLAYNATNTVLKLAALSDSELGGEPLHFIDMSLDLDGTIGGPAHYLLQNPSACTLPALIGVGATVLAETVSDEASPQTGSGTIGPWPTSCVSPAPTYAPSFTQTLSNPTAGMTSGVTLTFDFPAGDSTTRKIVASLPAKLKYNHDILGDESSDQCPSYSAPNPSPNYGGVPFDDSGCPVQAKIGTMTLTTPLLDAPVTAPVYLTRWAGSSAFAHFGVKFSASTPGNPPGVEASVLGVFSVVSNRMTWTWDKLPDIPYSQIAVDFNEPPRDGVYGQLPSEVVEVASPGDDDCDGGAAGASQTMDTTFRAWARASDEPTQTSYVWTDGC